ncbi:hypothetical protein H310_03819 [Aphanomyces invadans]|uniref:Transmembrane protein n=1 Tax=Aphanomyces invadans TaxID=157072 RepID=A0A024UEC2_9STRA|nr:hypothetical protein H310_03819 [Aphanomyces invadans]ETW04624.1 hypothetical protein H310_03819 [Aphanomyces invadans]|eukprot:XP_008866062.1 hypothetical protein H310_03819 [Aphanomyces invadans]
MMEPVPHHGGVAGIFVEEKDGNMQLHASKAPVSSSTTSSSSPWQKRSSTYLPTTSFAPVPSASSSRITNSATSLPVFRHCSALPEYFWRVVDYRQMDLEATYYQMVTLCVSPTKVYKSAYYRKQTKNRWARDDPAFAVIQVLFLVVASLAWAVAFEKTSSFAFLLLCDVLVEWLLLGLLASTLTWWCANEFLRLGQPASSSARSPATDTFFVAQAVEWQYAFDIHCNSFFIFFLVVHVLQFLFLPWLLSPSLVSLVVANTIYAVGCGSYVYITFLGYMALPFLHHTERFLYPIVAIGGLYLSSVVLQLVFGATFNVALMSATARRRPGMDNIFTGETSEEAAEKHSLRMDYAAVLQEQIREQNEKKERLKQQKRDEQRLEREEMDRMRNTTHHPASKHNNQQRPLASPEKPGNSQAPPHQSPTKLPAAATTIHGSPATFVQPSQHDTSSSPPPMLSTCMGPLYTPPPSIKQWRPSLAAATPELDAIQRLRQELEDARKMRSLAQKQMYQKPNFLVPSTPSVAVPALKGSAFLDEMTSPSPRGKHATLKEHLRCPQSRPTTPALDEHVLGFGANNNQLESSSSFVAVTIPEKNANASVRSGVALQVESCFVPLDSHHAPVALASHCRGGGLGKSNAACPELDGDKPKGGKMHCNNLEDSIDDIDAILHAFLAKTTR